MWINGWIDNIGFPKYDNAYSGMLNFQSKDSNVLLPAPRKPSQTPHMKMSRILLYCVYNFTCCNSPPTQGATIKARVVKYGRWGEALHITQGHMDYLDLILDKITGLMAICNLCERLNHSRLLKFLLIQKRSSQFSAKSLSNQFRIFISDFRGKILKHMHWFFHYIFT